MFVEADILTGVIHYWHGCYILTKFQCHSILNCYWTTLIGINEMITTNLCVCVLCPIGCISCPAEVCVYCVLSTVVQGSVCCAASVCAGETERESKPCTSLLPLLLPSCRLDCIDGVKIDARPFIMMLSFVGVHC